MQSKSQVLAHLTDWNVTVLMRANSRAHFFCSLSQTEGSQNDECMYTQKNDNNEKKWQQTSVKHMLSEIKQRNNNNCNYYM